MILTNSPKKPIPSWLANLFFFGLLIAFVLSYFSWQMHRINLSMQNNGLERSRLVAGIIEENIKNSSLTAEAIEQITYTLLNDKAHFIDYLDYVEPMEQSELTALAEQSGLTGITLIRQSKAVISGPEHWLDKIPENCQTQPPEIRYNRKQGIAYMVHPMPVSANNLLCVIVGIDASKIISVQEKTSLSAILATLSSLPGIHYIRLDREQNTAIDAKNSVTLIEDQYGYTAETLLPTPQGMLVIGLDAKNFIQRRNSLRHQFFLFSLLIFGVSVSFSWFLYRYQQRNVEQTRIFERMLAREHEAATLGRTTATIAHEVRNPLNAINMGLQRIKMESDNLTGEQEDLIQAMLQAVARTSTIVTELQRFTRQLCPKNEPIAFDQLVEQQLILYQAACNQSSIEITTDLQKDCSLHGDRELLAELVENILKNAIEAQPKGGKIDIRLFQQQASCILLMKNQGFVLSARESKRIGAPYFTTKTRGTGLGLALCKRIAEAHGGELFVEPDFSTQSLTVRLVLPLTHEKQAIVHEHTGS